MEKISEQELMRLVNRYIGVSGGYLGDFSYRTHAEFYPEYCGLEIYPESYGNTTRERFMAILRNQEPSDQAKIIRGIIQRFPVAAGDAPETRTEDLREELRRLAARLEGLPQVAPPKVETTSAVVQRALLDAETLLRTSGPQSAVDRVHTALHGYLLSLCKSISVAVEDEAPITTPLKLLRERHPALRPAGPRAEETTKILRGLAQVVDAMNTQRNKASVVHPNELLPQAEAMLAVNAGRTLFHYLSARLEAAQAPAPAAASPLIDDEPPF